MNIPYLDFAIALFIGALVGVDREKKKADTNDPGFAGLRTFMLLAEAGAIAAWLSLQLSSIWLFAATLLCITAMVLVGHALHVRAHPTALGLTSEVAIIVVFLLGGMVLFGHAELAVALGIATSGLLAFKEPLHGLLHKIDRDDIYAGLKLLIVGFIILPILPNRPVDPWQAINPHKICLLVILISALSLVGYIATRWLGPHRGTLVTGFFGGLVSSTAVSLSFAKRSVDERDQKGAADALTAGVLLAWMVMFGRVLATIAIVHRPLLVPLAVPMGVMGVASALIAGVLFLRTRSAARAESGSVPLKNPFSLTSAIKFALFFTAVLVVVKVMQRWAPGTGVYAVAAIAGLTDVDAITLSMAQLTQNGGALATAAIAITIATVSNTLVKCGMIIALGARDMKMRILVATVLVLAAGAVSLIAL